MHQLDACKHTHMDRVNSFTGHDGIHLHCCIDTEMIDCAFLCGGDVIAGIDIQNFHIKRCYMNSSCDLFRINGGCKTSNGWV